MSKSLSLPSIAGKSAAFGIGGWAAENLLFGPRYSAIFQGAHVPFLPIYAIGGLAISAAQPKLSKFSAIGRGVGYAAIGALVEFLGCQVDRELMKSAAWNYGQHDALARATEGCVDWQHTALWGVMGLVAEKIAE